MNNNSVNLKILSQRNNYDIIGDVHGYYDELVELLCKMNYKYDEKVGYYHEDRIAIFVGDLIDKGPKIRETLQLVKQMCKNNNAKCIMGNHEYNGVNFWDLKKDGTGYYRTHNHTNILQHVKTIETFKNNLVEWETYMDWFKTLPIIFETDRFRVVHASYHPLLPKLMEQIQKLYKSSDKNNNQTILEIGRDNCHWDIDGVKVSEIIESTLKGIEILLPNNNSFKDNAGIIRTKSRVKWWVKPLENYYQNYLEDMTLKQVDVDGIYIEEDKIKMFYQNGYGDNEKIVFFGHYCLDVDGPPKPFKKNVCCLDYGISKKKRLVAYRYDGESQIDETKYVEVKYNKSDR
jgi:hypothetical protein